MKLGIQVGLGPGHIVLDGDPAPTPPNGHNPQFSPHICCGHMAAWIKMSLGMELGLGPGDFVLDGAPALSPKGGRRPLPNFRPFLLWQNGSCIKMSLGMDVGLSPGDFVLDGDPAPFLKRRRSPGAFGPCLSWSSPHRARWGHSSLPKRGQSLPNFWSIFIVAKQLDASRCHLVWR